MIMELREITGEAEVFEGSKIGSCCGGCGDNCCGGTCGGNCGCHSEDIDELDFEFDDLEDVGIGGFGENE